MNDFTIVILNMICGHEVEPSDPSYNKRQDESMRTIFFRQDIRDLALNLSSRFNARREPYEP